MNRAFIGFGLAGCFFAMAFAGPARGGVDVHVNIGVPAPPAIVFEREPEVVIVPRSSVYYVPQAAEYDMYRLGPYWYINREGYWYRARNYQGPFTVIQYRRVPRAIVVVPADFRRHPLHPRGGPPGQLKKHWYRRGHRKH